jgi:integrase/recombinase XerD
VHKTVDQLEIDHFTAEHIRQFLQHLEEARRCSIPTRNQRLAAIHALAHFIAERGPEHIEWCGQIQAVPFKRTAKASITYLEKSEMDALLAAPDRNSPQGRRDYALLLFLYNTGARADEAAQLSIGDLRLVEAPRRDHSSVQIRGKGNKLRFCPLWTHTVRELEAWVGEKSLTEHVFINRCGRPLTRFGVHTMVKRYAKKSPPKCRDWRQNTSVPIRFAIPAPATSFAPALTSTRSVPGSVTSRSIQRMSMRKRIWR